MSSRPKPAPHANNVPPSLEELAALRQHAGQATRMLKALANPHRLMILCNLIEAPRSVSDLNARVPLSQSALSQHLALLRRDGIVAGRREGQAIHYRIADPAAVEIVSTLYRLYCQEAA